MDKASDFESEDCEFESRRGQNDFVVHPVKISDEGQVKCLLYCSKQ